MKKKIKEIRLGLGLTQDEMAKRLNISRTHYNRIENGGSIPTIPFLEEFCKVTGSKLDVIITKN